MPDGDRNEESRMNMTSDEVVARIVEEGFEILEESETQPSAKAPQAGPKPSPGRPAGTKPLHKRASSAGQDSGSNLRFEKKRGRKKLSNAEIMHEFNRNKEQMKHSDPAAASLETLVDSIGLVAISLSLPPCPGNPTPFAPLLISSDLKALLPNGWITGTLIQLWAYLVQALLGYRYLIAPLHLNANHWAVAHVDVVSLHVIVYDSMPNSASSAEKGWLTE
ncbi:hypothetical protein V8E36_004081 [Tilletia maclaganii]